MAALKIIFSLILLNQIVSFIISLLLPEQKEKLISRFAFGSVLINNVLFLTGLIVWIIHKAPTSVFQLLKLYQHHQYVFSIDIFIDIVTATFLFVGYIITLMVMYFSRYYMHREKGYKRFFNTILFFHLAYSVTVLAGNFITMFIGWEFLGISSFLLVAFYRERYLPVRNAVKIFSVYRFGDVGFIMGIWAITQIVHANINFSIISLPRFVSYYLENHEYIEIIISVCFLLAAVVKSAQFPFTYWIARAMEGPTPSSAIFYGSLSVNMGILLLFRTYYIWEHLAITRILFFGIGLITILMANSAARVQPSVKAQIGYSSATQVGFMFIELALGLKYLVLIHFASNAFLRTYQLLVSPSIASYLIRNQTYFSKLMKSNENILQNFLHKLSPALYHTIIVLSQKEWNLDNFITKYIFSSLKNIGKKLFFINQKTFLYLIIPLLTAGIVAQIYHIKIDYVKEELLPVFFSLIAFLLVVRAYAERYSVVFPLYLILFAQLFILLSVSYNESYPLSSALLYLSGIVFGNLICHLVILKLKRRESELLDLNKYYGHIYQYRWEGLVFLIGILCMIGFPITPTFIGEDIILEHIHPHQFLLSFFVASSYILSGIQGIRIYARIFLGPHCKHYHETAIKSA